MIKLWQKLVVYLLIAAFVAWPCLALAEKATTTQGTDQNSEDVLQEIPLDDITDGDQTDLGQYGDVIYLSDEKMAQLEKELNTPLTFDNIDPKYYEYGYFSYKEEKIISEAVVANTNIDEWQQLEILAKLSADDYYIMDSLGGKMAYLQNNLIAIPEMNMVAGLYNFGVSGLAMNKTQDFTKVDDFISTAYAQDNSNFPQQLENLYKESYCWELGGDHPKGQGVDAMKCNLTTISQNYESSWGAKQFQESALVSQLQETSFVINFFDQYTWWQEFFKNNPGWSHKDKISQIDLERFYFWNSTFKEVKVNKNWTKQEVEIISAWNKIINDAEFEKTVYEIWEKYAAGEVISLAAGAVAGEIIGILWKKVGVGAADFIIANVFKTSGISLAGDSVFAAAVKTYTKDLAAQAISVAAKAKPLIANSLRSLSDYINFKLLPNIERQVEEALPQGAGFSLKSRYNIFLKFLPTSDKKYFVQIRSKLLGGEELSLDTREILQYFMVRQKDGYKFPQDFFSSIRSMRKYLRNFFDIIDDIAYKHPEISKYFDKNFLREFIRNTKQRVKFVDEPGYPPGTIIPPKTSINASITSKQDYPVLVINSIFGISHCPARFVYYTENPLLFRKVVIHELFHMNTFRPQNIVRTDAYLHKYELFSGKASLYEGATETLTIKMLLKIYNYTPEKTIELSGYVKPARVSNALLELFERKFGSRKGLEEFTDVYMNKTLENIDDVLGHKGLHDKLLNLMKEGKHEEAIKYLNALK